MKLKLLIISIVITLNIQNLSSMEIYLWFQEKFGKSGNLQDKNIELLDIKRTELINKQESKYIQTEFDDVPKKEDILKARQILKLSGFVNPEIRLKTLELLLTNEQFQNKQESDYLETIKAAENIIIASYSIKNPGEFSLDYPGLILFISRILKSIEEQDVFYNEIIFKIFSKMPTLYSVLKISQNLKEIPEEIAFTQKGIDLIKAYANLMLDVQDLKTNPDLKKELKDALLQILIGKIGGSTRLLKIVNKNIESEANIRAEKIAKIQDNLKNTSNNFELAKEIKVNSVHIWALIFKRINFLKN